MDKTIYDTDYMFIVVVVFWTLLFIVFYTYIGYGILLYLIVSIRRMIKRRVSENSENHYEPEVTLFISAYNEKDFVDEKMQNCLSLDYPVDKLKIFWVTDGSDDGTDEIAGRYKQVTVLHKAARNGKVGAINRGMQHVSTPIVIFTDANTFINASSVRQIVSHFRDPEVGCVSGEKRILQRDKDSAAGAGEGLYWKYESALKKLDSELYSVTGAAGELFAIRTELFTPLEQDTILDDFMISLRIAQRGYTIKYDPDAYAVEAPSENIREELKRKIRISAGGLQSIFRLKPLLNIFRYGTFTFQYISHRVLRWTLAPVALLLLIPAGAAMAFLEKGTGIYSVLFAGQLLLYLMALTGWYLENRSVRIKLLFVPYYFFIMNLSVFLGFRRFMTGRQNVNWERAKRSNTAPVTSIHSKKQ